jgi:sugar phosphate isomerase/epimerase
MQFRTTRRGLFGGSAAVLASWKLGSGATTPAAHSEALKLGVASYSFRKFSRAEMIKGLQTLGIKYVNVKDVHLPMAASMAEIAQAKKEFEDAGIQVVGVGNVSLRGKTAGEDSIHSAFEYAKALGSPVMVMAPAHDNLDKIEKAVKEYDIKAAIHNHGPEDKDWFPTPESVMKAVKGMDQRMGLCIDIGHTVRTGADVVEAVREALKAGRLHDMHTKDLKDLTDKDSQVSVGDGVIPIVAIFKELEKGHYKGYLNHEYEIHADDPIPGMQKSFSYMRGVLDGLKG